MSRPTYYIKRIIKILSTWVISLCGFLLIVFACFHISEQGSGTYWSSPLISLEMRLIEIMLVFFAIQPIIAIYFIIKKKWKKFWLVLIDIAVGIICIICAEHIDSPLLIYVIGEECDLIFCYLPSIILMEIFGEITAIPPLTWGITLFIIIREVRKIDFDFVDNASHGVNFAGSILAWIRLDFFPKLYNKYYQVKGFSVLLIVNLVSFFITLVMGISFIVGAIKTY